MTGKIMAETPTLRGVITKPSSGGGTGEWTQDYTNKVIEIIHNEVQADLGLELVDGLLNAVYEGVEE